MIEAEFISKFDDADAVDMSDTTTNITEENIKELHILADRYPQAQSAIIPMLHLVQSIDGKVSGEGVRHIARILDLPEAVVLGVVTFYTMFHKEAVGKHLIGVCTTSLCAVMGGDMVYETVRKHLGLDGEGTTDHQIHQPGEKVFVTLDFHETSPMRGFTTGGFCKESEGEFMWIPPTARVFLPAESSTFLRVYPYSTAPPGMFRKAGQQTRHRP